MTTKTRQLVMLAALAIVLAVVVWARFWPDAPAETAVRPSNSASAGVPPAHDGGTVTDVKLELLQGEADGLIEPDRNPFRFEVKAPPPPPPEKRSPPREFTPPPPPVPAGPPPPPPIPLRFIGIVAARDGSRAASFSDGRGNNFLVREGDIIEGRYKVLRLETESVELAYLDGRGRQTIRLSGQ